MQEVTKFHILSKEHFSLILWQTKIFSMGPTEKMIPWTPEYCPQI